MANAISVDEVSYYRTLVSVKNREAYDAETTRNNLAVITGVIYVYNILDAIIFFPEKKLIFQGTVPIELPKVEAGFDGETASVKLTASF